MESLYILVPLSIVLVFLIGGVFWWALQRNQFDNLDGVARSILEDDDKVVAKSESAKSEKD